jgi:hypothetical protein
MKHQTNLLFFDDLFDDFFTYYFYANTVQIRKIIIKLRNGRLISFKEWYQFLEFDIGPIIDLFENKIFNKDFAA